MAEFKLIQIGVRRLRDGAEIPADPANRDWRKFLAWKEAGGIPDPEDPPPRPLTERERVTETLAADPLAKALVRRLAKVEGKTVAQIETEILQEAPDE